MSEYSKWPSDHPYAYTIGDVEYREAPDHKTGQTKTLLFALNKWPQKQLLPPTTDEKKETEENKDDDKQQKKKKKKKEPQPIRKVFVSFKIKRISNIDCENEKFHTTFHIYFSWLPTYDEYMSFIATKNDPNADIYEWQPQWYPQIEFVNEVSSADGFPKWVEYPGEGRFRMQQFKRFFDTLCDDRAIYHPDDRNIPIDERNPIGEFGCNDAYFVRAKLDCNMSLSESLELQHYPFDVQDLTFMMRESSDEVNIVLLPEMRKAIFASLDPTGWSIDEWDFEGCRLEIGQLDSNPRAPNSYAMILSIKLLRRWRPIFVNTFLMLFLISVLSFTVFSIDFEDTASRLGFIVTLILTIVLFDPQSTPPPYLTLMDKYILLTYGYLVLVMIENSLGAVHDKEIDDILFYVLVGIFLIKNIGFIAYAYYVRKEEILKLSMGYDEIQEYLRELEARDTLRLDYRKRMRSGINGRFLSFVGYMNVSAHMNEKEKVRLLKKQEEMNRLYEAQTAQYGYNASDIPQAPTI